MSETASPLKGADAGGIARISEPGVAGMITIRGHTADPAFSGLVGAATGCPVPDPLCISGSGEDRLAWMSSDELLWLCGYAEVQGRADALAGQFEGLHAMAVNVSDTRTLFDVEGFHAREVLAKLCPIDLAPATFRAGMFRRTRLAQVAVAIWMEDEDRFRLVCARSVTRYVSDVLTVAAGNGSSVGIWD